MSQVCPAKRTTSRSSSRFFARRRTASELSSLWYEPRGRSSALFCPFRGAENKDTAAADFRAFRFRLKAERRVAGRQVGLLLGSAESGASCNPLGWTGLVGQGLVNQLS